MKKTNIKIFATFLSILIFFTFSSCSGDKDGYGPIFYNITREVALEKAIVEGNVYSMVDAGTYLYTCNGYIYKKLAAQERNWEKATLADSMGVGNSVIRLASTDGYIYALTNSYRIYCAKINSTNGDLENWTELSDNCATITTEGNKTIEIFDNDAEYGTGKRRAFYSSSDGSLYEFSGTTAGTTALSYGTNLTKADDFLSSTTYIPIKAAYISSADVTAVSNDMLLTSNRTSYLYHMKEDYIYYSTDGSNWDYRTFDSSAPISLCYYTDGTNEWIYAGKKAGIEAIILNIGIPTTSISSSDVVGSNTTSCLGDSTTRVIGLYPYPQGSGNIYAASVIYYSSTAASNKNRLWGYYPVRSNGENNTWNRE